MLRHLAVALALAASSSSPALADGPGDALAGATPTQAVERLAALVDAGGEDANDARFALAVARTLAAVETLGGDLQKLGPRTEMAGELPFLRLDVPVSDGGEPATADAVGRAIKTFAAGLVEARGHLDAIDGPVSVALPVGQIGVDFDGDGTIAEEERLVAVLESLGMVNLQVRPDLSQVEGAVDRNAPREAQQAQMERMQQQRQAAIDAAEQATAEMRRGLSALTVDFDDADVQWLIAYTHLLEGMADAMLAHDPTRWFEHCGHLLFRNAEQPYDFLQFRQPDLDIATIGDIAAAIHLARFPVRDADRLRSSREHFLTAAAGSREMFRLIRAETDDGREWIPNPQQSAAFPNIIVSDEIIDSWLTFVGDVEALLNGDKLIPFWRGEDAELRLQEDDVDEDGAALDVGMIEPQLRFPPTAVFTGLLMQQGEPASRGRGVNLRRVFEEQRELDVVLWVQGTAAAPYLEEGELITAESFERMQEVTGGNFFTFAAWFN